MSKSGNGKNKIRSDSDGLHGPDFCRRDVLKSLVAGFAAVPLLPEKAVRGWQNGPGVIESTRVGNMRSQLFDRLWRFHRGDVAGADRIEFDDTSWRQLDLPHDWSIEHLPSFPQSDGEGAVWGEGNAPLRVGPFDIYLSEGQSATGWCLGGIGWYRKHFTADQAHTGSQAEILFEGVYMNSDVWLNGHHLGFHPYGYTSFAYDLTPYLSFESENVLAVRVRNVGQNSRWYSGSGIYRHVWLNITGPVRVQVWGVFVTTLEVSPQVASVKVAVKIENHEKEARVVTVRVRLLNSENQVIGSREVSKRVDPLGEAEVEQTIFVRSPALWSLDAPHLHRAEVELVSEGQAVDHAAAVFGIRKIEADAQRGLRINGEVVKLRGGCMHHANGLLGSAAIDRAEERRVELMKAYGFNAIRCAHNPPSPKFLDACDRLGIAVIDEAFDQWLGQKNPQDYHLYFENWWRRDIDSMVLRDRNHPSVIFWSIGNEIPERADPRGIAIAKELVDEVRRLDPTRLITEAIPSFYEPGNHRPWIDSDPAFDCLDVGGYNYQWQQYEPDHARAPHRVMMGTESFPYQAFANWQMVNNCSYVIGDFVWSGMDYLGESGVGNAQLTPFTSEPQDTTPAPGFASYIRDYPWFNAFCGDIDLTGEAKPQLHHKRVIWGISKLEMAVQRPVPPGRKEITSLWGWSDELRSWTWPGHEGNMMKVRITSSGDKVKLVLNDQEIGMQPVSAKTQLSAEFDVAYTPGVLKAIALEKGRPVAELAYRTVGKPAALFLKADRSSIHNDRNDLAFVTLEIQDRAGELVPDATVPVVFGIRGVGELAGMGTANPKDVRSFRQVRQHTFHGKALAIVRPTGSAGTVIVSAQSEGLRSASVALRVS